MHASQPTTKLSTMLRVPPNVLAVLSLVALPAVAAPEAPVTGITRVAPAAALFVIAAALLLTLVFRSSARHLLSYFRSRFTKLRVRRALSKLSGDSLHDMILPGAYGGLVRIDHAIMTAGGILCIRAMPMHGTVFGAADEPLVEPEPVEAGLGQGSQGSHAMVLFCAARADEACTARPSCSDPDNSKGQEA